MNIENMEQEFPKMPQSMRDMIEKEVLPKTVGG